MKTEILEKLLRAQEEKKPVDLGDPRKKAIKYT